MESLLAQVEAWFVSLIDKRIDDRGGLYTREAVEKIVVELDEQHANDLTTSMIEEVIDNCIADKIISNFDISDYDSEITDIAVDAVTERDDNFDISDHEDAITALVVDAISATSFTISVD